PGVPLVGSRYELLHHPNAWLRRTGLGYPRAHQKSPGAELDRAAIRIMSDRGSEKRAGCCRQLSKEFPLEVDQAFWPDEQAKSQAGKPGLQHLHGACLFDSTHSRSTTLSKVCGSTGFTR